MRPAPRHAAPPLWRRLLRRLPKLVPLSGLSLALAIGVLALLGALLSSPAGSPYLPPAQAAPVEREGKPEQKQPASTEPSSKASTGTASQTGRAPDSAPSTEARRLSDPAAASTVGEARSLVSLDAAPRPQPGTTSPPDQGASPSTGYDQSDEQADPDQLFQEHKARHEQGNGYAYGKHKQRDQEEKQENPPCE
jgi:hypothetical protein